MDLYSPSKTPRKLCEAIDEIAKTKKAIKFTKRPRDRFNPETSPWWLVPNTSNPHYKHSKILFDWWDKKNKNSINCAYQIEKGLDEQIQSVYSSKKAKRFIMNKNWVWHTFIKSLKEDNFFSILEKNFPESLELTLRIEGGYVIEPTEFDPYQEKSLAWDKYDFLWNLSDGDRISLVNTKRKGFVLKLHHINSLQKIKSSIIEMSENPWLWLNFFIMLKLDISPSLNNNYYSYCNRIWDTFINPLYPWIK